MGGRFYPVWTVPELRRGKPGGQEKDDEDEQDEEALKLLAEMDRPATGDHGQTLGTVGLAGNGTFRPVDSLRVMSPAH